MSNIVASLKERNITSQIRYYGLNDMATGFEIKNIVGNYDLYNELIDAVNIKINNIDNYINYLYLRCLMNYKEVIPFVRDDAKDKVENIVKKAAECFKKYKESDLAKFITKNYKKILSSKFEGLYIEHDIIDFTIELMCKYCNEDSKAMEYIINNYSYQVYDNFDSFKKIFDESNELYYYDLLLEEEIIKKNLSFRLNDITKVLKCLRDKNEEKYNKKMDFLIEIFKKESFNANINDIMNKYFNLRDFTSQLEELKHPKCYEFKKELERQKKIEEEYLKKNGSKHSFTIDIKPIIDILENDKLEWYIKSLSLTHTQKGKNKISVFEDLMLKAGKKGILDYVTSDMKTDDTFTYHTINTLSVTLLYGKYALNYMTAKDPMLNDLLGYIIMGIYSYFKNDSIYFDKEKFELDMNMIYDGFIELNGAYKIQNETRVKRILYGLEVQLCGIIEKILRAVYMKVNSEQEFIPFDSLSLNTLLNQESLNEEIGKGNCQCIQYLISKRNKNISKNIRNDFCHYNDNIYQKLNIDTILETLYVLLVISNTLLCIKED